MVVGDFAIDLDTVVIGSGPGGYVAAIRAAEMGQKVTVIESTFIGGVCLNVGCIPSKALINAGHRYQDALEASTFGINAKGADLDFTKTQEWKQNKVVHTLTSGVSMLFKKHKIDTIMGTAFLKDDHSLRVMQKDSAQTYTFKNLIIATGSRPIEIKGFKFGKRILDSTGGLNLPEVPKEFVVIGGGYIGSELASAYANLGAHVTILEGTSSILPNFEKDMVQLVLNSFKKRGVTVITNAMAKEAEDTGKGVKVTYTADGKEQTIAADYVMVTVGRRPNTDDLGLDIVGVETTDRGLIKVDAQGRTNKPNIYAIGDIVPGAALAHKASYEGKVAAESISGKASAVDYKAMPAVCFTDPELATTGMTVAEAKDKGIKAKASKFPFAANGRALSLAQTEGFVRLVTNENGTVIGGQVAGAGASDLISELTVAVEGGLNVEDLALTIHPHPTLSEVIMDDAEVALGLSINI
ncbi:dihydrolipoyl dehydrogenase [Lacticaseibacillus paracasei]|jgi:dihydrolipoamide dehydrogenase|uniref:Dihydrolipoyl dehydrogenase n=3 Tax=Lacticaseibacillus paracasei subsp. paracasei TaxID=47714 RepID=A0A8E0M6Q9_LACPA|nr:dihydrolipoyl dehydrogenase [Lacticaseibacillus paracasei]EKQ21899.1 dihydrolipoamide dehydrogenase of pyruvate dehydrogenase complex [Lacticaseibacillus casei UW4]EPC30944.1 pyruvatedehydrogenase complex, Dihydrolipoamide dehydrogenase [Lacticaseibacillus paracasei subsp. paracasei Lpp22]OJF73369.1 dihydrolipoyl dehydrogenase [Lacticaseibacillus casei]ATG98714.1 dihydrolipoyl dehydrogenase [Lacticaseibacillus paracasei]EKQ22241.1 dihydrolipoamide dehydrogenase of pyruvate dehydrogenase com